MVVSLHDDAFDDATGALTQHVANGVCMFAKWAARKSRNLHAIFDTRQQAASA